MEDSLQLHHRQDAAWHRQHARARGVQDRQAKAAAGNHSNPVGGRLARVSPDPLAETVIV